MRAANCTSYVQRMYNVCTTYVQRMYNFCTISLQHMYNVCTNLFTKLNTNDTSSL